MLTYVYDNNVAGVVRQMTQQPTIDGSIQGGWWFETQCLETLLLTRLCFGGALSPLYEAADSMQSFFIKKWLHTLRLVKDHTTVDADICVYGRMQ